jgi:hypothetical protein
MSIPPVSTPWSASTGNKWPLAIGAEPRVPELAKALETLETYFTPSEKFRDVSRGKPLPHSLSDAIKQDVGLTRETWKLEVISDPDNPAKIRQPLTKKYKTALDFAVNAFLSG